MKKGIILFNCLCLVLVLMLIGRRGSVKPRASERAEALPTPPLVVLAETEDPYTVLADEIAQAENALRLYTIEELETVDAAYVIYITSLDGLTESKLLALSALSLTTGRYPAVGLITGATQEQARALWIRGAEVRARRGFVASAPDVNAGLDEGRIWELTADPVETQPLTKENVLAALEKATYFYWARHVGATNWFWYKGEYPVDDERITGADLPVMNPVVIHTPSCRSFVPWAEDSIALAFIERGAAAYLGHLYPPISSAYFIGHLYTLPGYDTWPGLPMGVLAQIQNRATQQASASHPLLFMLGDPRIALQANVPYTITSDVQQGNRRVIQGNWTSAATTPGVLPLRIADGAAYQFVRVKGVGAVADSDPFYNSDIQTLNVQADKVALVVHPTGAFEVELRATPPLLWHQVDALRDAFEFVWCSIAPMQALLGLMPAVLLSIVVVIKHRRKMSLRPYLPALCAGVGWTTVQLVFSLFHTGRVSVTSYVVQPALIDLALAFMGTSAVVTLGLTQMMDARKPLSKLLGLGVCVAPTAALLSLYIGITTLLNVSLAQKNTEGLWPMNYAPARMAAIVGVIEVAVFLQVYLWLHHRPKTTKV